MRLTEQIMDDRARAVLAMSLASYALDVPLSKVAAGKRDARAAMARQVAMYVAHVAFGMSTGRVGSAFGRDRSTVSYACKIMEDMRDEPRFDRWMEALERSAEAAPAPFDGGSAAGTFGVPPPPAAILHSPPSPPPPLRRRKGRQA